MNLSNVVPCLTVLAIVGLACQSPSQSSFSQEVRRTPLAVTPPVDCAATVVEATKPPLADDASSVSVCPRDLIRWSRDGHSEERIMQTLEERRASVTLTAADENLLRDAGVSESLIEAMKASSQR